MQASQDLFDLLVSKDFSVKTLDNKGKPVVDPSEAEMFSFDFETANKNYGTVVCLINDNQGLEMYYGDNVGKTMEKDDKDTWYDFLNQMKRFATRNLFQFDLKNMNRLRYSMQGMAAINEGLFEGWNGTKMTSYNNKRSNVRLKIVHDKPMEETDQRWRAVKTMFIETPEGERFKLPFKSTSAGKAMTRHVIEGGNPYDAFGNHIVDIVRETNALARFLRGKTRTITEDHEDYELVQELKDRYKTLRKRIKQVTGKRGYHAYKESWNPAQIEEGIVGKLAKRLGKAALKHGGKIAIPAAIGTMIAMNEPQDTDKKEPSPSADVVKKQPVKDEDKELDEARMGPFMKKMDIQKGDTVEVKLTASGPIGKSGIYKLPVVDVGSRTITCAHPNGKTIQFRSKDGSAVSGIDAHIVGKIDESSELDEAHPNSKVYDKCWDGYKKVPGKKRGEKGSCVKEDELEEAADPKILAMKLHRMLKKYDAEADTHYDMYGQPDFLATIKLAMAGKIEDAAGEFVSNYTDQDGGEAVGAEDMYEELKYEIRQIMGNNVQANEGFRNELEGGKVPVGNYTFVYTMDNPEDLGFVVRSAEERGMAVLAKGKTKARIDGNAGQHTSLVRSLQDLSIRTRDYNGSVTEPHRAGELQMESVPPGSYMIWTVEFADGTTKQYKGNDEAKRSLEKKHPEAVKISTDWVVRSDDELYDHAQANTMKELNEFENWADEVSEGTWAIPDTKDKVEELADLMSRPMIVGIDGADAQDALYDIIGDDDLMDDLYALAQEEGADADARPVVMNWIGAHEASFPGLREKLQGSTQESAELDEGSLATDTPKAKMAKLSKKSTQKMNKKDEPRYSQKEADDYFKKTYKGDKGNTVWHNGHWMDDNTGEMLLAKEPAPTADVVKKDIKEGEDETFYDGDLVVLVPPYAEDESEVFTLTQWDEMRGRGFIADEDGRGWYVDAKQITHAPEEDDDAPTWDRSSGEDEYDLDEAHDLDTSEPVKKQQRDPMLEAADWARLAGLSQKVYAEAEGELEEDILPFGWGGTSPAEMMSKLRKNFPNDPRWGNEEGETPPVSGTINREVPSDGGPDGGGLGDRYSPPTKDGVSPPTRRVGEAFNDMDNPAEAAMLKGLEDFLAKKDALSDIIRDPNADEDTLHAAMTRWAEVFNDAFKQGLIDRNGNPKQEESMQQRLEREVMEDWGSSDWTAAIDAYQKNLASGMDTLDAANSVVEFFYDEEEGESPFSALELLQVAAARGQLELQVEEGNAFSGALANAKRDGKSEFEVDGKTYKVDEADAGKYGQADFDEKETQGVTPGANTIPEKEIEEDQDDFLHPTYGIDNQTKPTTPKSDFKNQEYSQGSGSNKIKSVTSNTTTDTSSSAYNQSMDTDLGTGKEVQNDKYTKDGEVTGSVASIVDPATNQAQVVTQNNRYQADAESGAAVRDIERSYAAMQNDVDDMFDDINAMRKNAGLPEGMADVMGDEEIRDPFPELPQIAHDGDADSYADKYSDDGSRVGTQGKDTADDDLSWIKRAIGNK